MTNSFFVFVNNHRKWFIGAVVIALLSLIGIPVIMRIYDSRQKFDWNNYDDDILNKDSDSPFGAKYYIEHLNKIWKGRVECDSDLVSVLQKHNGQRCNYIVFENDYSAYSHNNVDTVPVDELSILKFYKTLIDAVGTGNNILFCNSDYNVNKAMLQQARYNMDFSINDYTKYHSVKKLLVHYIDAKTDRHIDSALVWNNMLNWYFDLSAPDSVFAEELYSCYEPYGYGRTGGVLRSPNKHYYAVARHFGKGCALLSGAPMLFSNYVLSVPDVQRVSDQLLYYTFDKKLPLVIIYRNKKVINTSNDNNNSGARIFEVMYKNPATKVAMYLLIIMLLLVVLFNSRRRRNVVNEIKREENSSLSYIRHLATLYSAKSDYKELLEIEQRKILYQLRKEYCFDIRTKAFTLPSEYTDNIVNSKGGNKDDVKHALTTLESLTSTGDKVNKNSYIACLQLLNTNLYSLDNK